MAGCRWCEPTVGEPLPSRVSRVAGDRRVREFGDPGSFGQTLEVIVSIIQNGWAERASCLRLPRALPEVRLFRHGWHLPVVPRIGSVR